MTEPACRIYEDVLTEHAGDANAALLALAARYAALAAGVSRGFLRRPVRPGAPREHQAPAAAPHRGRPL